MNFKKLIAGLYYSIAYISFSFFTAKKAAIKYCDRTLALNPLYHQAYYLRGLCYAQLENWEQFATDFDKAFLYKPTAYLRPSSGWYFCQRAMIYIHQKKFNLALVEVNRAIQLQPDLALAYYLLTAIYNALYDNEAALHYSNIALQLNSEFAEVCEVRTIIYRRMGDYKSAFAEINRAIKLKPKNPTFYLRQANLYHIVKNYSEVLANCDKALKLNPKPELKSLLLTVKIIAQSQLDPYYDVYKVLRATLDVNSASPAVHLILLVFEAMQPNADFKRICADLLNLTKKDPESLVAKVARYTRLVFLQLWDVALLEIEWVLKIEPCDGDSWIFKTLVLVYLERPQEAEEALLKVIEHGTNAYFIKILEWVRQDKPEYSYLLDRVLPPANSQPNLALVEASALAGVPN